MLRVFFFPLGIVCCVECSALKRPDDSPGLVVRRLTLPGGQTLLRWPYMKVDFSGGYGAFLPFFEGYEPLYEDLAKKADEVAFEEQRLEGAKDVSIVKVDDPLSCGTLMLATLEMVTQKPGFHGGHTKTWHYDSDLVESFKNYAACHSEAPYERVRGELLKKLSSFPEGQLLASGMYKTKQLPRVYCNYSQYIWVKCFLNEFLGK